MHRFWREFARHSREPEGHHYIPTRDCASHFGPPFLLYRLPFGCGVVFENVFTSIRSTRPFEWTNRDLIDTLHRRAENRSPCQPVRIKKAWHSRVPQRLSLMLSEQKPQTNLDLTR